jgi:hypothetical protein
MILSTIVEANPIPIPIPASMPLEEMWINIEQTGVGFHAAFTGNFTFDYIPATVTNMWFPVPIGSSNIQVRQDGINLPWIWSTNHYPTLLPEEPSLPMIEWSGPFPTAGAVFSVDYEHDLIERPTEFVFFYALGTGKYFPTYDKVTTANFHVSLSPGISPSSIWLDTTLLDPSQYTVIDSNLELSLNSNFGPFTKD